MLKPISQGACCAKYEFTFRSKRKSLKPKFTFSWVCIHDAKCDSLIMSWLYLCWNQGRCVGMRPPKRVALKRVGLQVVCYGQEEGIKKNMEPHKRCSTVSQRQCSRESVQGGQRIQDTQNLCPPKSYISS